MDTRSPARILAYGCIVAGIALAFLSAVVPHYTAGYRLAAGILFAGLLPYLVYALCVPLLRAALAAAVGVIVLILHAILVFSAGHAQAAEPATGLIYVGPLVLALCVSPLFVVALREPYGAEREADNTSD